MTSRPLYVVAMHPGRLLPDESLARELMPPLLVGVGVLAAFSFGALMLVQYRADLWPYALAAGLLAVAWACGELLRQRRLRAAGAAASYALALLPILSAASFGFTANPALFLAAFGVAAAGLLMGPGAPLRVAAHALLLLAALLAAPGVVGQGRPGAWAALGVFTAMALLLLGVAALTWAAAHHVRGTIGWALETARKSERREALLRQAQADLEQTLRERDQLNDRLIRQSAELAAARAAAETAYRSKASFMATMSHELRTPLNIIIGFSSAMVEHPEVYDDAPLPASVVADLSEIRRSGQHLLGLINDILDLARVEAGRLELNKAALPLGPVLDEMLRTAQGLLKDRPVLLRREYRGALPTVVADEVRIRQVLLNLVSNACKFTSVGEVGLGARADTYEVVIWVRDTGIGIAEIDQGRIFNQFEQVESVDTRQHTGTGLGLSISRWLVELHGGRMWLESELGKGSIFYFTLPRARAALLAPNGARVPALAQGE
ncbi:MAG TPA: HAMP domain-containing sensor histidine kinase [Chloroflexaceae bacterium]|nr:HAMP domain-containing sensor histidine kinase [Chloroflexaceae bacterium]